MPKIEYRDMHEKYSRYLNINREIDSKRYAIYTYTQLSDKIKSADDKVNLLEREIEALKNEQSDLLEVMLADFQLVGSTNIYQVLVYLYVDGLSWDQISKKTGYVSKYLMQLRNKGLLKIKKVLTNS